MENHTEKNMEHDVGTGVIQRSVGSPISCIGVYIVVLYWGTRI